MDTILTNDTQNLIHSGIKLEVNPQFLNANPTYLIERLRFVTISKVDPELGKAWRNRMIIRSRLRKYASG